MSAKHIFSISITVMVMLAIVGCQSSTSSMPQAMAGPQRAVIVTTGNSGSTVVFLPSADPANPVMLSASGADVCPDCKAAAIKYFQTGVLESKCSRCGATRTAVTLTTPSVGHQ